MELSCSTVEASHPPIENLVRLSVAAHTFNDQRVYKRSLATYTAQARRRGWVSFGTETLKSVRIGRYWFVDRAEFERAIAIYSERQARPALRTIFVDQREYRGWVTAAE